MTSLLVDRIFEAKVADDRTTVTVTVGNASDQIVLAMDWRGASLLVDALADFVDKVKQRSVTSSSGMRADMYRNCNEAMVNIDATLTTILIDFDPKQPHRLGVALPLDGAVAIGREMVAAANRAKNRDRKQRRQ